VNRDSKLQLSPKHKDYEKSTNEGEDEEIPLNKDSMFPLSPNPKDYETATDEWEDEEFPTNDNLNKNRVVFSN